MSCQTNTYRLRLEGTAQKQRPPLAFRPDYVRVDEHRTADWMVFARMYARFLNYYNPDNLPEGDWTAFYTHNPAMVLANLAAARVDWYREEIRLIYIELQKLDQQANTLLLQEHFNRLFDVVANLALQLDEHFKRLPEDQPFRQVLGNLIQTSLAPALKNWVGWQQKASQAGPVPYPLINAGTTTLQNRLLNQLVLGEALQPAVDIWNNHDFSKEWLPEGTPDWTTFRTAIFADVAAGKYDEVFGSDILLPDVAGKINFAIRHFFFTNAHEQFLKGFAKASSEAATALNVLLNAWNRHEPHLALYFAFLRLFEHERDALNTFTERHLGFYYRDVLHLREKISVPGQAYVTFELAKNIEQYLLREGLKLKAGKDQNGKEIHYALLEALVANQAKVAELRCILKAPGNPALYQFSPDRPAYRNGDVHRYFAAPVANSSDGVGAELTSTDKQWHIFGNKTPVTSSGQLVWNIDIPAADVGFAIASNYLFLQEGSRTVSVRVDGPVTAPLNNKTFRVRLTTEKGWHETTATFVSNTLSFTLDGAVPAITPYNAKVHGGNYPTTFPVLECRLPNQSDQPYHYEALKHLVVNNLHLSIAVTGKKDIALSGSTGPIDSSKPFHPFGQAPGHGSVFYVGDKEVFQKKADVTLHLKWKELDDYNFFDPHTYGFHPYTEFSRLSKGQWVEQFGNIINHSSATVTHSFAVDQAHLIPPDFGAKTFFQSGSPAGFVRFELNGDWGHAQYPMALTKYIAKNGSEPARLYDPQILECSMDYTATTDIPLQTSAQLQAQSGRLLHLHPFGFAQAEPTETGGPDLLPLMAPQYSTPVNTVGKDGGEFFIGISDFKSPQILSLLIQVAEGSADPLLEKPENHVIWSYLKADVWVDFEADDVADGTVGLLQSGLLRLAVPREADTVHNLLPTGMHWIRARVASGVDAVCKLIGVHAQGARAQWTDAGNGTQFNALPLAEGSIAKLLEPDSAVKKTVQPYAGFGGRSAETTDHFFTRVSERLRHKNRGITLWDYERLVLEQFPYVHRARCLNHLQFEPSGNQFLYRELAPGHVTLIIVSNLRNRNAVNPLRPYTSLGNLKNIHDWLKPHLSCFVTLHVRNPLFEPVRAEFKVKFLPGFDETFYTKKLNDDIIRFLSPWAFDAGEELVFGGKMHKSTLVNFIEEQPYVDYLTDLKLIHLTTPPKPDQETVEPSTQCSVLVSADEHWIEVIHEDTVDASEDCGCGVPLQNGNA